MGIRLSVLANFIGVSKSDRDVTNQRSSLLGEIRSSTAVIDSDAQISSLVTYPNFEGHHRICPRVRDEFASATIAQV